MSEKFLMPAIDVIADRYKLSATVAGIIIAFGIAVPELSVTILSFQRHGIKMTEFGLAVVFGGAGFCSTFVPAFAYFINFGCRKPRPAMTKEEIENNGSFMRAYARDMLFIIAALIMLYIFLETESLDVLQCCLLLGVFPIYCAYIWYNEPASPVVNDEVKESEDDVESPKSVKNGPEEVS